MIARVSSGALALVITFAPAARAQGTNAYVVTLGNDTTAVEQYMRTGNTITGDLVTRQGGTVIAHYVITVGANGAPSKLDMLFRTPSGGVPANGVRSVAATYGADSSMIVITRDTAVTRRFAVKEPYPIIQGLAPSMAMYEVMFGGLHAKRTDSIGAMIVGPTAAAAPRDPTYVKFHGADSARVWSFGYPIALRLDANGRVLGLSGRGTTQKIEVRRVQSVDIQKLAAAFATADAAGRGLAGTAASAKDSVRAVVSGAHISVDYFRPMARGRNVFSRGVLGDTIWRTGANNATAFKTDKDLVINGRTIPAGSYTLWTHAAPDNTRYELIFNKQTGQWGTEYHADQDLVRVPLTVVQRTSPMEAFQIGIDNGLIRLSWRGTDLTVPFTVKP